MILLLQILNEISACMVAADRPTVLSTVQRRCKKVDIKDFKKNKKRGKNKHVCKRCTKTLHVLCATHMLNA